MLQPWLRKRKLHLKKTIEASDPRTRTQIVAGVKRRRTRPDLQVGRQIPTVWSSNRVVPCRDATEEDRCNHDHHDHLDCPNRTRSFHFPSDRWSQKLHKPTKIKIIIIMDVSYYLKPKISTNFLPQTRTIRSIEFHFHEFLCILAIFVIIPKKMHENQH